MTCKDLEDSLAAYAIGALDEEERRRVELHLRGCESCTARVRELTEAANELPRALAAASPLALPPEPRGRQAAR